MSIRVVYDTMLFLQAIARPGRNPLTFASVRDGRVVLCISTELIEEVRDVLSRPGIVGKFPAIQPSAVDAFLLDIAAKAELLEVVPRVFTWPQHPDDDHVFNLAIHAKADMIVTWETRILQLPGSGSAAAKLLRELSPHLRIITPIELSNLLPQR